MTGPTRPLDSLWGLDTSRLAIVGTPAVGRTDTVVKLVRLLMHAYAPIVVVTSGEFGVAVAAETVAGSLTIPVAKHLPPTPDWDGYNAAAEAIALHCTALVRIVVGGRYPITSRADLAALRHLHHGWAAEATEALGKPVLEFVL